MKKLVILLLVLTACATAPEPYGPIPTSSQLEWQKMEINMFTHFGPNTFSSLEWGTGTESEDMFNPTALDCRQWTQVAKAAGMKGIIITAKHHDGFCLWPNPESKHTVAQSKWKDGKGDVLKELSDACRDEGVKFGIYISPWDRHDPHYGTEEYNGVFERTLENALSQYGPVFEQWFDGACGEGENGKRQVYDWPLFHSTVRKLQPDALMFSDIGPDCRWVGNESGVAGRTSWSRLDVEGFQPGAGAPSQDTLNAGNVFGKCWIPSETDVSIRPGWFYHESEDSLVKSVDKLLSIYYTSVGRNSLLLLNVPPDQRGRISSIDSLRLVEFRAAIDSLYAHDYTEGAIIEASETRGNRFAPENMLDDDYDSYWAPKDETHEAVITLALDGKKTFNRIMLMEYIPLGQRIAEFHVDVLSEDGEWVEIAKETTIGYKRIVPIETITTDSVRIVIDNAYACPVLNKISLLIDSH